jgi:YD repeat-containing protein
VSQMRNMRNHFSLFPIIVVAVLLSVPSASLSQQNDGVTYTYDVLERLIKVEYANGAVTSYTYDAAGNRIGLTVIGPTLSVNTNTGNNVTADANGVTTRFTTVTNGGTTSIAPFNPSSVGVLPNGSQLVGDSAAFNISTTATTQGSIELCFNGYFNTDSLTFARLRILHNENGAWVNRTTTSDLASRTVCSTVSSIGQFAVVLLGPPTALIDSTSNRAAALNSVTLLRDPVTIIDTHNFSVDQRARLAFFVQSVDLLPAEGIALVTAQAQDSQDVIYPLTVESALKVPNMDWLTEVIVRLPDTLIGKGDIQVSVTVRGIQSEKVVVRIQ